MIKLTNSVDAYMYTYYIKAIPNQQQSDYMLTMNSARFRRSMYQVFNTCIETSEPVTVTTNKVGSEDQQRMVIISEEQYLMMVAGLDNKGKSDE